MGWNWGEVLDALGSALQSAVPFVAVAIVFVTVLLGVRFVLLRNAKELGERLLTRQVAMLLATGAAVVLFVLVVPLDPSVRSELLGLLGLLLSAALALASTTFVSNAMAGIMLRIVDNFKPGDFVRVGDLFGRVSERGLFHVEVQTEERDLATLPNMHLVTNPVTVVRASGTIVSATLSLGYDEPFGRLEPLMLDAARAAELEEPFVHVLELGNFAVTYRVAGFLREVKTLLTARSRLRASLLDTLHAAGVEIASPTLMNQRPVAPGTNFAPGADSSAGTSLTEAGAGGPASREQASSAESIAFDKAERAGAREELRTERAQIETHLAELADARTTADEAERARIEAATASAERRRSDIDALLEAGPVDEGE